MLSTDRTRRANRPRWLLSAPCCSACRSGRPMRPACPASCASAGRSWRLTAARSNFGDARGARTRFSAAPAVLCPTMRLRRFSVALPKTCLSDRSGWTRTGCAPVARKCCGRTATSAPASWRLRPACADWPNSVDPLTTKPMAFSRSAPARTANSIRRSNASPRRAPPFAKRNFAAIHGSSSTTISKSSAESWSGSARSGEPARSSRRASEGSSAYRRFSTRSRRRRRRSHPSTICLSSRPA